MSSGLDRNVRLWGMACHLPLFLCLIVPVPLLSLPITLGIWLSQRSLHPFVDDQGKESLNFQLSFLLYQIVGILLFLLLASVTCTAASTNVYGTLLALTVGSFLLVVGMFLLQLLLALVAVVRAEKGEMYRYPYTIRFLK